MSTCDDVYGRKQHSSDCDQLTKFGSALRRARLGWLTYEPVRAHRRNRFVSADLVVSTAALENGIARDRFVFVSCGVSIVGSNWSASGVFGRPFGASRILNLARCPYVSHTSQTLIYYSILPNNGGVGSPRT
jgi:hypothetical protein